MKEIGWRIEVIATIEILDEEILKLVELVVSTKMPRMSDASLSDGVQCLRRCPYLRRTARRAY